MAYAASNPPACVAQAVGAAPALWLYVHTDVHTDVDATDYFSNGAALGMRVNDIVLVVKTSATIGVTAHVVTAVTAGGAATIAPAILA
jgi:hypothetical protein